MKYFKLYRKLIFLGGALLTLASAGSAVLITGNLSLSGLSLFAASVPLLLYGLLLLLDRLHCHYDDDLLEKITLLIEALVEQQEQIVFPEDEDTLTARLQHQLLKLRNILKAQNQLLAQEKEQIKTLISDISHQIKTPVAACRETGKHIFFRIVGGQEQYRRFARCAYFFAKIQSAAVRQVDVEQKEIVLLLLIALQRFQIAEDRRDGMFVFFQCDRDPFT